ncbi:MAG: hypothetical protein PHX62_01375 [Bacilli bacterium]|nr:hypothetical protein [Bacilli bacterium]
MKKCTRCGTMVPDNTKICDKCAFDFDEYEKYYHLYEVKEDPVVPEGQRTNLTDFPILTFIFGIISLILSSLFLFTPGITVLYIIGVVIAVFITYILAIKPSKIKLVPFQVIGKWMANVAISVMIFKIVYVLFGLILQ